LPGNEALLLTNVRFIKEEKLNQELLFARPLVAKNDSEKYGIFHSSDSESVAKALSCWQKKSQLYASSQNCQSCTNFASSSVV
ncbi:hypothetical protein T11_13044, partial [Trichinella zimbabwensis]